jgi:hypothetical protein
MHPPPNMAVDPTVQERKEWIPSDIPPLPVVTESDRELRTLSHLCHLILLEAGKTTRTPPRDTKRKYIPTPPSTERVKPSHQ